MGAKWGWYQTLYHLAQGDILKIDSVTEVSVEQVFTFLCYEQDAQTSENINVHENRK